MEPVSKNKALYTRRKLPALLVTSGFLLLVISAGFWVMTSGILYPGPLSLPESLAGQPVIRSITGPLAIDEINQLHGKSFQLTSGAVGWYGPQKQITLWVSGSPMPFMAGRILNDMQERINEGRSPFQLADQIKRGGRMIYEMDGMGQKHFTFRSRNLVIWLAIDSDLVDPVLTQVLEVYP